MVKPVTRSQRRRYNYNFRYRINQLERENRARNASYNRYHVISCYPQEVEPLLRLLPYAFHWNATVDWINRLRRGEKTGIIIPYDYARFPLVYNLVQDVLGYDPKTYNNRRLETVAHISLTRPVTDIFEYTWDANGAITREHIASTENLPEDTLIVVNRF